MAVSIISEAIYTPVEAEKPGFVIATGDTGGAGGASGGTAGGGEQVAPIAARLQTADAKKGEQVAKKCLACHTLDKGQPNKVGPNLYNVVGSPIIHPDNGFSYSQAFQDKTKEGFTWTFEHLDGFLTNPRGYIPGTAMSFAGLKKPEDRADVIDYLRTLSDNPEPLPPPPPAGDKAAAAPAAGAAGGTAEAAAPAPGASGGGGATAVSFVDEVKNGDVKKGESSAKKCLACHTLEKGQPNKVGPNLYGVVGTPIIRPETGYDYSQAFQAKGKEGFTWTYDHLNVFLTDPRADIPGTKMTFAGIKKEQERADVVAYLRTLADTPAPLPADGGNQPAAPAADTGGQAAPAAPADNTGGQAAPAAPAAPADNTRAAPRQRPGAAAPAAPADNTAGRPHRPRRRPNRPLRRRQAPSRHPIHSRRRRRPTRAPRRPLATARRPRPDPSEPRPPPGRRPEEVKFRS